MKRKEQILQRSLELYPPIYSSTREQDAFIQGAKWADETMLNKACEWLKENMGNYIIEHPFLPSGSSVTVEEDKMVEDFRKAMEGEL